MKVVFLLDSQFTWCFQMLLSKYNWSKICRCISGTKCILEYIILQNIVIPFKEERSKTCSFLTSCEFPPENKSTDITFSKSSVPVDPFLHSFHPGSVKILLRFYQNITNILGMWGFQHTHIAAAVYYGFFSKLPQALILRKPAWIQFILIKI